MTMFLLWYIQNWRRLLLIWGQELLPKVLYPLRPVLVKPSIPTLLKFILWMLFWRTLMILNSLTGVIATILHNYGSVRMFKVVLFSNKQSLRQSENLQAVNRQACYFRTNPRNPRTDEISFLDLCHHTRARQVYLCPSIFTVLLYFIHWADAQLYLAFLQQDITFCPTCKIEFYSWFS